MKNLSAKILTVSAFCLVVFGCKKNDGKGRLYLSLKSVNKTTFVKLDDIHFEFEFSHPISESINDSLFVRREFFTCPYFNADTPKPIAIPQFTSTADYIGIFDYKYQYGNGILGCSTGQNGQNQTDSAYFYFCLKDKNGVLSDTVRSPKIILNK